MLCAVMSTHCLTNTINIKNLEVYYTTYQDASTMLNATLHRDIQFTGHTILQTYQIRVVNYKNQKLNLQTHQPVRKRLCILFCMYTYTIMKVHRIGILLFAKSVEMYITNGPIQMRLYYHYTKSTTTS